ncbi:hypothetical protein GCM10010156_19140 [Planobispora rosea]|uniref:Large ribosomal subunit protein bL31 n=2 Tax=Planobispora rosea TaxID=35762 RepID=A0A8J3WCM1_PLARO|nr:hypothetical protein GCM10010156_19140 [Planobispora rosea]GIH83987.1 hypothetical protein Pro02_23950 [Planobispora rosea]
MGIDQVPGNASWAEVVAASGTLVTEPQRFRFPPARTPVCLSAHATLGETQWRPGDRALERTKAMKPDIHPEYVTTQVTCTCGNTFTTRSTAKTGSIHADVCSACHPFYTGKQKILDTGGRVARFEKRFGKKPAGK